MPTTTTKSIQVWGSPPRQSHGGPSGSLPSGGARGSTISIRPPPTRDKESGLSRRERVVLAQLRCNGKSPILQKYLYDIATPICSVAKARTISTMPFMTVLRSTFFGASSRETPWSPFGRAR
ncbi:hypothetical protein ElyMa_005540500 [Elysia marginata]|uniref:Uncharacterized protein n=1 Tax=Elysia marginata TaxID=1093978 RepID=A0AAV4EYM3_9GAST|nr:hypothetical protein ElyMa_005540500 [Elysia marginata]